MSTFDRLAGAAAAQSTGTALEGLRAQVSSGFERLSTVVHLQGGGIEGVGEDVVYDARIMSPCSRRGRCCTWRALFAGRVLRADRRARPLPGRARARRGVAAVPPLDVSQRRAGPGAAPGRRARCTRCLEREARPVTFVVSLRLGEPATLEPIRSRLAVYPTLRFKLDATNSWTSELIDGAGGDRSGRLDRLQGALQGERWSMSSPDPVLYRRGDRRLPRRLAGGSRHRRRRDRRRAGRRARPHHLGRAHPLDRRHRGAAVRAPDGQPQALAHRGPAQAVCHLRLLRRARHRRLRGRPVRARSRARARLSTWPRCFTPTRPTTWPPPASTSPSRVPACPPVPLPRPPSATGFRWGEDG